MCPENIREVVNTKPEFFENEMIPIAKELSQDYDA
jgi:hypothetical protein